MNPVNNLNYLLHHLAAVISKQLDQVLREQLGIGLSQYKILMVLEWNPRLQQKAIAESLGQTEASISRQIKLLKDKKLLTTKVDNLNQRRHLSLPTPLGLQITEAAGDLLRRNFSSDLASFDDSQILRLNSSLQKLHQIVCRPGKLGTCDHQLGF
jgi:DNA-binding MarR family transcriptional regulator